MMPGCPGVRLYHDRRVADLRDHGEQARAEGRYLGEDRVEEVVLPYLLGGLLHHPPVCPHVPRQRRVVDLHPAYEQPAVVRDPDPVLQHPPGHHEPHLLVGELPLSPSTTSPAPRARREGLKVKSRRLCVILTPVHQHPGAERGVVHLPPLDPLSLLREKQDRGEHPLERVAHPQAAQRLWSRARLSTRNAPSLGTVENSPVL